jgi:anti-sigma-K factor RskA
MIAFADTHAVQPAPEMKQQIAEKLKFSVSLDMDSEMVDSIIIQMPGIYKLAAAAAIALIIALAGTTFYFGRNYRNAENELADLRKQNLQVAARVEVLSNSTDKLKTQLAVATSPENQKILLKGLPIAPGAEAVVYWNKETGSAYIDAANLPAVPTEKQYQLWAIVAGKPVDLGVIARDADFSPVKQVQNATAFAITLERAGGNPTPTMDQMYVMGAI